MPSAEPHPALERRSTLMHISVGWSFIRIWGEPTSTCQKHAPQLCGSESAENRMRIVFSYGFSCAPPAHLGSTRGHHRATQENSARSIA